MTKPKPKPDPKPSPDATSDSQKDSTRDSLLDKKPEAQEGKESYRRPWQPLEMHASIDIEPLPFLC